VLAPHPQKGEPPCKVDYNMAHKKMGAFAPATTGGAWMKLDN
jgi:hypothetical protein